MKCPHCHSEVSEDSEFCSKCGTRVSSATGTDSSVTKTLRPSKLETLIGTTLAGKYLIECEIGRGGMGIVYRAQDIKLKRTVAVKFLPPEYVADADTRERFMIEAQAAAALSHPNICTIYEIGEADDLSYIAMEYVEGQSLKAKVKKEPLKVEEATDMAIQVANGLGEAHKKGIIHRDIKSANIMVTAKGQAKIMDFGLAKLQGGSSLTKSQTTLGTVAYMSPEQARGKGMDSRTDIWSLGVVLYEMLSGKLPFQGEHDQAVIYAILHEEPESLKKARPEATPEMEQIIGQALAKNPADRYKTMEEFREDMEAVAEGLKPLKAKRRRVRRILGIRTAYVYSALVILLALILGLNVGGLRNRLLGRAAPAPAIRLAVLPFENLSGDPQQEYFSDGMTQEMIAQLGCLHPETLSVIARTSVMRYKKTNTPIGQIGRELNVGYVLEGSAQREGTRVRITAELIKARDQTQIWAETFDQDASSLLALQSEVAQKVAGALALKLLPSEQASLAKTRTIDPAAYEAYLKGSQYWIKMTPGDLDTAQKYFNAALQKQPDYAAAYTGLAWVWTVRNQMWISHSEAVPKAKAAALKAVELDDSLAEAHYVLAAFYTWPDWDMPKADAEWKRAVALNPNYANGLATYSHYLTIVGRPHEAMTMIKKALDLDPFNVTVHSFYANVLFHAHRLDDAIARANKALEMQPDNWLALSVRANAYGRKGMDKEAIACLKQVYSDPDLQSALDKGFAEAGLRGAYGRLARALESRADSGQIAPTEVADAYVWAQDKEQALKWYERCYEVKDPNLPYIGTCQNDLLLSDPRFQDLLRKMGFPTDKKKRERR